VTTTSYRAGAFLDAARAIGIPVVVGSDETATLASLNPSGHLTLDFADPAGAIRSIVEHARTEPIAAVVAADDDGVVLAARAAAVLGLVHNSPAAVVAARDKLEMRKALEAADVPGPRFQALGAGDDPERAAGATRYPCVLKPVALSASRGVIRADRPEEFVRAFRRIAALLAQIGAGGPILVEDYLPGGEVALEGLLSEGRLRCLAIFDKPEPLEGPFFEETLYVAPSRLPEPTRRAVAEMAGRVASALGLAHGPVHAEFRITTAGPIVLEIAPRPIGGLCSRALRFGAGMSLEELVLRHALGTEVEGFERESRAAGVLMIPIPRAGRLQAVSGEARAMEVPGVEEIRITIPLGDRVVPLPEGSRYLGFVFARHDDPAHVEEALREAQRRLQFEITAEGEPAANESPARTRT
jgi:biotin carboxylase